MALSKPLFCHLRPTPFPLATLRRLSFATLEEAAAERRPRKRRLRIEPPLSHSRPAQQTLRRSARLLSNPNTPKLPESMLALSGKRLELHNRILALVRENDLKEASLLTRHSIYSNCRPTAFTCNAVLYASLRQARYSDLLILHRFITQASVPPSLLTHNILLQAYCDCRRPETALEHFRVLLKDDSTVFPSPTSYRILAKGLVDVSKLDLAVELKDGMLEKGFVKPDLQVYNILMGGFVNANEPDKAVSLFEEWKEKVGTSEDLVSLQQLVRNASGVLKDAITPHSVGFGVAAATGEASRKGFYIYDDKRKASIDPEIAKYVEKSRRLSGFAPDSMGLTASGVKIKQVFVGDISSKYQNGRTTIDVKVDSYSTVSTTVTVNEAIAGLKSSFSFKIPDHKSGKLNLQYLNEKIALNCGIGMTTTPLLDCAASVGIKELSFGAEVGFDSASASFTKYNCGVGYNKPDFSASLVLADKGETLKASYIHLYNPKRGDAVAAELTHRFNSGDNNFALGSSHAIDPLTTLKTRVCDRGRVAVLCQHQWRPKSFITLSAEYDPKAFSEPSKVGLALALKP